MELRKKQHGYFFFMVTFLSLGCSIFAQAPERGKNVRIKMSPEVDGALEGISIRDLRAHVKFLSSDLLEGRSTPGRGIDIAAEYLAAQFGRLGLEPAGSDGNYLQMYSIEEFESTPQNTEVALVCGEEKIAIQPDENLLLLFGLTGQSPNVSAPIVFAGYGITSPEHHWDDYAKIDVRGKTVLVLAGAPWVTDLNVIFGYDKLFGKLINAKAHGAAGFIYASPNFGKEEPLSEAFARAIAHGPGVLLLSDTRVGGMCIPSIVTSWEVADRILGMGKVKPRTAEKLSEEMMKSKRPMTLDIPGVTFQVHVRADFVERSTSNVIGMIRGSDEKLRDEFVVFSAHFDHVGISTPVNGDSICNGADDNASGTAAVLELAEAFISLPVHERPRRSLLFLLVSGEEKGLLGSAYYSEHPKVPISRVIANINIDMVGRSANGRVQVIAPGSESLYQVITKANSMIGLEIVPDQQPEMRLIYLSDQYQFARHDIPVAFFFTGIHPDYHQPSDEIEKVNFVDFEKITRLIFLSGLEVANSDKVPEWSRPEIFIVYE